MTVLRDLCSHVRSKNAGPYWVTVDFFFDNTAAYARCKASSSMSSSALGQVVGVAREQAKCFAIDSLQVIKFSYPRRSAQGGMVERDLHSGQQFVKFLDIDVS